MKFAAVFFSRFRTAKSEQPDAFELRLISLGGAAKSASRSAAPTLFHRRAQIA